MGRGYGVKRRGGSFSRKKGNVGCVHVALRPPAQTSWCFSQKCLYRTAELLEVVCFVLAILVALQPVYFMFYSVFSSTFHVCASWTLEFSLIFFRGTVSLHGHATRKTLQPCNLYTPAFPHLAFPVTGSESNRTLLGCGRMEDSQHESAPENVQKLHKTVMLTWTRFTLMSPKSCGTQTTKN